MTWQAAAVGGAFTVLVALVERGRRQNGREHGENSKRLDKVLHQLGRLDGKLEQHLDDHRERTK